MKNSIIINKQGDYQVRYYTLSEFTLLCSINSLRRSIDSDYQNELIIRKG